MVEPMSMLVYPVGMAIANVITKSMDSVWLQPQAYDNRQKEIYAQHELRLKELQIQYENSVTSSLINSGIRVNEQQIIEQLRASISIGTNRALRDLAREDSNNPFVDSTEIAYKNLKDLYEQTKMPIILVSPFWDDTKPLEINDRGGYVDFRNAFNTAYRQVPWQDLALKQDGYFKRPLYRTDRDVNFIYSILSEIPTILIHGIIQGGHDSQQYVQRIHPHVTFWNLFSGREAGYTSLDLKFLPFRVPSNQSNDNYQTSDYSLGLQDTVGIYLSKAVGLISSFYHLYHFETRPNLWQFQLQNEQELLLLSLQINELYDFLGRKNPDRAKYYQLEKSLLPLEEQIRVLQGKQSSINYSNPSNQKNSDEIRLWFAEKIEKLNETLTQFSSSEEIEEALQILCSTSISFLEKETNKLRSGEFYLLVVGNFNSGKGAVVNTLLKRTLIQDYGPAIIRFPIHVKYGKDEKVLIHRKDGSVEYLGLDYFYKEFFLRKTISEDISLRKSNIEWLESIDHIEINCPAEVLADGVTFIYAPGFTPAAEGQLFSYLLQCHAILSILDASNQITYSDKEVLKRMFRGRAIYEDRFSKGDSPVKGSPSGNLTNCSAKPIFYLINKWYLIEEENREEVHDFYIETLSECLNVEKSQFEAMQGERLFKINNAVATARQVEQGEPITDPGLIEFQNQWHLLMTDNRLLTELSQAMEVVEAVVNSIVAQIDQYCLTLRLPGQSEAKAGNGSSTELRIKYFKAFRDKVLAQFNIIKLKYNRQNM